MSYNKDYNLHRHLRITYQERTQSQFKYQAKARVIRINTHTVMVQAK